MRYLILALALVSCGKQSAAKAEADAWRGAKTVFLEVDGVAFMLKIQQAMVKYGQVTVDNAPPEFKAVDGLVKVWTDESRVPGSTSYAPMEPHQAAVAALKTAGVKGLCIDPNGGGCARTLTLEETQSLEKTLRSGAGEPMTFKLTRSQ